MQRISGASGRFTISTFRPFGRTRSTTWLESVSSWPRVGAVASQPMAATAVARHTRRLMFMSISSASIRQGRTG